MTKTTTSLTVSENINHLDAAIQSTTKRLFELADDDIAWWKNNIISLTSPTLITLKQHLYKTNDITLDQWSFSEKNEYNNFELDIIESIIWLTSLCNLDKTLIGKLPPSFVDCICLHWRTFAYDYLTE